MPCSAGSAISDEEWNTPSLNIGTEADGFHRMSVESRLAVRIWRPSGGGKTPAVTGIVCDESTVMTLPEGTGVSNTEMDPFQKEIADACEGHSAHIHANSLCHSQTLESSHPAASTGPRGCQCTHCTSLPDSSSATGPQAV